LPEDALLQHETLRVTVDAIAGLPAAQRAVITMRDVQGCAAEEVCQALGVSDGNQRVLLHRARSRVRAALERHLDG
jgi:RNA polymerase sigma-70 factor (ECF subfamily)